MFKLDLEKAEEWEIKLPTSVRLLKNQGTSRKHLFLVHWLHKSLWLCGSQQLENSERSEYQTTLPSSWENCMQVQKQQLELNMEQQTGSKLGKECIMAVFYHPVYLTYKYMMYL